MQYINHYVKQATRSGAITLMPCVFGRGVDFVCVDKIVNGHGGVCVIQAFLSEDVSEEYQIMARQGRKDAMDLMR